MFLIQSCTILATSRNELVTTTHDRMPVILNSADYDFEWTRNLATPMLFRRCSCTQNFAWSDMQIFGHKQIMKWLSQPKGLTCNC